MTADPWIDPYADVPPPPDPYARLMPVGRTYGDHPKSCDLWAGGTCTCSASVGGLPAGKAADRGLRGRALTRADLADLPTPEPLIEGTVDRRTVTVLAGHYGTCKSFLAQDWAACIATGKAWMGRHVTTDGGRVLYVAAEGAFGLDQRFVAWEYAWNRRRVIPADNLTVVPVPVNLGQQDQVNELCELSKGCDLVVIDTLARCLVGADENSARDVGLAVDALYRIRNATGNGTVLALHHTGKDKTTIRGSSALEAGVDTVYKTEGDTRNLRVYRTKRKDGPMEDSIQLRLNAVDGTESAVLSRLIDGVRMTDSEDKIVSHLRSHFGALGATRRELVDTSGIAQPTVYRAVTSLLSAGMLRSETKGNTTRVFLVEDE